MADIIAYVYSVDENGDPDQVLGSQTVSTLSVGDELEMYIEFDTPVEVTEDFAVGFGLGKTSAEEFNVLFDFNSGRDEGLAILRQPGDESWLVISPDSIASKFNVSASEVEDNFDFYLCLTEHSKVTFKSMRGKPIRITKNVWGPGEIVFDCEVIVDYSFGMAPG